MLTYDPVNGQKIYVNGRYTGDVDPKKGGSMANWDDTFALVMGNETTGNRQWLGVIKFVAIHSRALTADQVQQNFAAGVGERYFVLFDVSALSAVPQSYIMFTGSVYDSYSYLFSTPTFISLNPNAVPGGVPLKGIRIGVNGVIGLPGQSFSTINTTLGGANYTAANGQLLSAVGTVIPSDKGVDSDMFFLSFDQFGTQTHVFTEPVPVPQTPADNPASADVGVRDFASVNATMSTITGINWAKNTTVNTAYLSLQQSLPPSPDINSFLSSQQSSISQLAQAYCGQMVATTATRTAFFGNGLEANLNATAATFFVSSGTAQANRNIVVNALVNNVVGNTAYTASAAAVTTEINALLQRIPQLTASTTVSTATTAACTAVLGSAAVSVK